MRFVCNGAPVLFRQGDSVLTALLRHGVHSGRGGCLCLAGDCPHRLATVDRGSYTRTCQTPARAGLVVQQHPADGLPPLESSPVEASVTEARSVDLAFITSNLEGWTTERWSHSFGCRRWMTIRRATTTDRVASNGEEEHG